MRHPPLIVQPRPDFAMLRWVAAMLPNCTARAYRVNKERLVRLAQHRRDELHILREEPGISYDERARRHLQLFRKQTQHNRVGPALSVPRYHGLTLSTISEHRLVRKKCGTSCRKRRL